MLSYILIVVLLGCAFYFTYRCGFVQFRMFGEMIRIVTDARGLVHGKNQISSFQAFTISLASRVGTGNLAGVAVAIAVGGVGAVFWMWVVALFGAATSFVESTLAQLYKRRSGVSFVGGPAYYIESGLGLRWLGLIFAVLLSTTFGFAFNSVQSNTICSALKLSFGLDPTIVGVVLTLFVLVVIFGGVLRVAKVSSVVVPIMALGYLLLALVVLVLNIEQIPHIIGHIFNSAFGVEQAVGGVVGGTLNEGIKRGLFSNEAGMGSSPNVAATASVSHPVKQGLIQALGVFVDTLLICSCTAVIILLNRGEIDPTVNGIQLTQEALTNEIGPMGGSFVAIAVFLFAFSSIISSYYYGEVNIRFITDRGWVLTAYRLLVGAMVLFGALVTLEQTIVFADVMMAFMTLCNLFAVILLGGKAVVLLRDYRAQVASGVANPTYRRGMVEGFDDSDIECWE